MKSMKHMIPLIVLTLLLAESLEARAADQRPNVMFILTDDQGWPTLGSYGGKIVPTPHLDRLAAEGARFTDAYVTSQCTPTRATFLTGQYTARNRLWHVLPWYGLPWARMTEPPFAENFSRETFTIAKGLQAAGYATGIIGKWHLTSNGDGNYMGLKPTAARHYGFDFAPPVAGREIYAPGADRGVARFTEEALGFVSTVKDRPWFCFLSHHMIHGVVVAPDDLTEKYRKLGYGDQGPNRAVYLAGLETIDHSIGRLIKGLRKMGELDNTLIFFTSDNGGVNRKYAFQEIPQPNPERPRIPEGSVEYDNTPLREGKGSIYEGGIRVPFIAWGPGLVKPGVTVTTPIHIVDMAPTLLELAGTQPPDGHPLDGQSIVPLLRGDTSPRLAGRSIFQYYPFYDLRWNLTPSAAIRQGDYKLIEFFGDRVDANSQYISGHHVELYNLRDDIGETRNLTDAEPTRAKAMRETLRSWMAGIPAEVPVENLHHEVEHAFVETKQKPARDPK